MNQNNISLERVIKGLECHKRAVYGEIDEYGFACNQCPYKDMESTCHSRTEGDLISDALALLKAQEPEAMDAPKPDSDIGCWYDITHNYTLEQVVSALKEQEPPTSEFISSAIECLLHPQDADDSDMAKAIDTAVRAMRLLKAQEPKAVIGVTEIYKDIWLGNCPSCDQSIVNNINKSTKYCRFCGQAVKWE